MSINYPSKLDPIPEIDKNIDKQKIVKLELENIKAVASPSSVIKIKKHITKPTVKKKHINNESGGLTLGTYVLPARYGSGYWLLCSTVAECGQFENIDKKLSTFDPTDKNSSQKILETMFVDIPEIENNMRINQSWIDHCKKKLEQLTLRAENGNRGAKNTLNNPNRVKDGVWLGNIREMISTCSGSSSGVENNNISKFKSAGLVFRQFPKRPKKGVVSKVTIFASKYTDKVKTAIKTVYGIDEDVE